MRGIASLSVRAQRATRPGQLFRRFRVRALRLIEPSTVTGEPFALVASVVSVVVLGLLATHTTTVPYGAVVVPVLIAGLFLRTKASLVVDLAMVAVLVRAAIINGIHTNGEGHLRLGVLLVILITSSFAHIIAASRERLGVQGLRGDAMLA